MPGTTHHDMISEEFLIKSPCEVTFHKNLFSSTPCVDKTHIQLMDIWVVSTCWAILNNNCYKHWHNFLCRQLLQLVLLTIYLGGELLGHMVTTFNYLKDYQTISQGGCTIAQCQQQCEGQILNIKLKCALLYLPVVTAFILSLAGQSQSAFSVSELLLPGSVVP